VARRSRRRWRTMIFVDEAAFSLLPFMTHPDSPRGQTPVWRVPLMRDHLSVITAITSAGRLFAQVQEEAVRGPAIVAFLRQWLRQVRGQLLASCS
jgi:hypothetical protein